MEKPEKRWGLKQHEATIFHWIGWGKSWVFTINFFLGFPVKIFPSSNSMNIAGGFKQRIWAFTQQWEKDDGETDRPDR